MKTEERFGGFPSEGLGVKTRPREPPYNLSFTLPSARTMQAMHTRTEKLPQGLRKANACGGDVRRKDGYNRRLQSPAKQESPLARVGVPWVYPWGDVKITKILKSG
ncbi:MAG: hypothetical protein ACXVDN_04700 [Ktedonobacteraceae bacterium]